ncbi:hypothetical protein CC2G_014704 [Coprinopsis cinerea AmutBmut pab1-1]|nr:hypothetical protein CC2G_014704 [Coprinopsis cinerea AmutBmut pab1-1]
MPNNPDQVYCKVCTQYNLGDYGSRSHKRKGYRSHKTSKLHKDSERLRDLEERAIFERAQEENITLLHSQSIAIEDLGVSFAINDQIEARHAPVLAAEQSMWDAFDSGQEQLVIDDRESREQEKRAREFEERAKIYGLWGQFDDVPPELDGKTVDSVLEEQEYDDELTELLIGTEPGLEEILAHEFNRTPSSDPLWHPYPSKLTFLLDAFDNMPRLRLSAGLLKVLLWLLRELGVQNVPGYVTFRKLQERLRNECGVRSEPCVSPKGNAFYFNNPADVIRNDWCNPEVARHIRRYIPISKDSVISEIWHGTKWRFDLDRHALSPMYDNGLYHFYVDELAQLEDGSLVVPVRWLEDESGGVFADAWKVKKNDDGSATVVDSEGETIVIEAAHLKLNLPALEELHLVPIWSAETVNAGHPARMPNPDRALAGGEPLYTSFIDIFADDVSGNRSKSWNKHWNLYTTHRNLPRQMLFQESNIHFISTSQNASIAEQFRAVKDVIEGTHKAPIKAYDAHRKERIRLRLQCNCGPGDNPSQSESSGHIGGKGNFPCRKCKVGGTQKEKETDKGFHSFFEKGEDRTLEETLAGVDEQIRTACTGVAARVAKLQTETGIKDAYAQHWIEDLIERSRKAQKDEGKNQEEARTMLMQWVDANEDKIYNPFLKLNYCDFTKDTPVEILHTVLLGAVKYSWHGTHTAWTDAQKSLFSTRLQSTAASGLSIPPIRAAYIMQYANSLIGRQFKILVQTNTFHVHDLVSPAQYAFVKAMGDLSALLWYPEIRNPDDYFSDVEVAVANVLDAAAQIDPSKIIAKIKYHLLVHITDDIRRHGPIIGVATESYESFNTIFRLCSVLSNHLAPSRDIAYQLSEQETVRHLLSGGRWFNRELGEWDSPGRSLINYVAKSEPLKRLFALNKTFEQPPAGTVRLAKPQSASGTRQEFEWTQISFVPPGTIMADPTWASPIFRWFLGQSVISGSGDKCVVGSWIFTHFRTASEEIIAGRIIAILRQTTTEASVIILQRFQISHRRHEVYSMPVLVRPFGETAVIAVAGLSILFEFNAQHDCYHGKCLPTGERRVRQERMELGRVEKHIQHTDDLRFVINTHALHNAHLLRLVVPGELIRPLPLVQDRAACHRELSKLLRASHADSHAPDTGDRAGGNPAKKRKQDDQAAQHERGLNEQLVPGQINFQVELTPREEPW